MVKKIILTLGAFSIALINGESWGMRNSHDGVIHSDESKKTTNVNQLMNGKSLKRPRSGLTQSDDLAQSSTDKEPNELIKAGQCEQSIRVKRPCRCVARVNDDGSLEISNMYQFNTITKQQANTLTAVIFCDMNIDDTFCNKFRELFPYGMKTLVFKRCYTDEVSIAELLGQNYPVRNLKVIECGLEIDDADRILRVINSSRIQTIDLSGNEFNREDLDILEQQYCERRFTLKQPIICNPRFIPD